MFDIPCNDMDSLPSSRAIIERMLIPQVIMSCAAPTRIE